MFFWNFLAFSLMQWMLAIWSLVPLSFLNSAWTSGNSENHTENSMVHVLLKPGLENFEHYFASVWDEKWKVKIENVSHSVVLDSLWPHGLWPTRLLRPWDSSGKNTGVGCHILLQEIFPTQGLNSGLLDCRIILYHWTTREVYPCSCSDTSVAPFSQHHNAIRVLVEPLSLSTLRNHPMLLPHVAPCVLADHHSILADAS